MVINYALVCVWECPSCGRENPELDSEAEVAGCDCGWQASVTSTFNGGFSYELGEVE